MPENESRNGWNEWSRHILATLKSQSSDIEAIRKDIQDIKIELATQRVKVGMISGFFGILGGAVIVIGKLLLGT